MNQCDGCRAGQVLSELGMHIDADGHSLMVCQRSKYNNEPKTKQQLIADMRDLSQRMIDLGAELDYFGGLNTVITEHASELVGAGYILETWANGIEEE